MFPILSIGPISLPLPPLLLILGFWLGITITDLKAKQSSIDPGFIDKLLWTSLISGLIGARLSFIARNPQAFQGNLVSIVSINPNLFDIAGGILIAFAVGFIIISNSKIPGWKILDLLSPLFIVLLISISLSRFASGDDFGTITSMPWGIFLWGENRHPVQLYYFIANLFVLMLTLKNFPKDVSTPGKTFLTFSIMTTSLYLFLSGFQETQVLIAFGLHLNKILFWLLLTLSLTIYWIRNKPAFLEDKLDA